MSKYNVYTFVVEGRAPYFNVTEGLPKNPSEYFTFATFLDENVIVKYYYTPDCDMESFFLTLTPFDWLGKIKH